jgi:hypothetical protein
VVLHYPYANTHRTPRRSCTKNIAKRLKGPSEYYSMLITAHESDAPVDGPSLWASLPLCPRAYACTTNRVACRLGPFPQHSGERNLDTTDLDLCWLFVAGACVAGNGLQGRVLERLRCCEPSLVISHYSRPYYCVLSSLFRNIVAANSKLVIWNRMDYWE